jgi:hypothetical protein
VALSGSAADVAAALNGITTYTGAVTLTTQHDLEQLKTINIATTGAIRLFSNSVALSGSAADVAAALNGITAYTGGVTLNDTTLDAAVLNTVNARTSGTVDAASLEMITGIADSVTGAYLAGPAAIAGLGDEAVSLSDVALDATQLVVIDSLTGGVVDAETALTLTGNLATLNTAYEANAEAAIVGLGDEAITLTDMIADAAPLNALDSSTTGPIDAGSIQSLTGDDSAISQSYSSIGITNLPIL